MKNDVKKEPCVSDEEIIELYWNRNEKAIEETDKKYGRYLYTIAYNIIHDNLDCEECLNDTYLGTWNRIPPTRPNAFQIFLSKIMRNVAIDRFRQKTAEKRIPSELVVSLEELDECLSPAMTEEEETSVRELARVLNDYLHSLSDKKAFVFICRYYYSDPIATIAKMLGIGESTVHRHLKEMREELREILAKEGLFHEE